jgi:hypothetical protein
MKTVVPIISVFVFVFPVPSSFGAQDGSASQKHRAETILSPRKF